MKKLLGCVAAVAASLTLSVSAAENVDAENLIHRWSFNGSLTDACGGNTAVLEGAGARWNDAAHPTGVTLPGGYHGAGAIDLGYSCAPAEGGEMTIEIFAKQDGVAYWARLLDWGQDTGNYLIMTWCEGDNPDRECLAWNVGGGALFNHSATMSPFSIGTMFHISARIVQRENGGLSATFQKRDAVTGELLNTCSTGTDAQFPIGTLNNWRFWLGRSQYEFDSDAAATYDEVRIWKRSLSDEQLAWSARLGPDTLPTAAGSATTSTINVSVVGSGTIAATGADDVTSDAAGTIATAARSASVTLTATPAAGSVFRRWTGDTTYLTAGSATTASITLDAVRDANLVAEFVSATDPLTAIWTGYGNDGDPANAANWECRNGADTLLPGVLPTAMTAVTVAGDNLTFNCPVGTSLAYASLVIGDCTLAADCDWRGLGAFAINGKVDLDGHTLRIARLEGTGGISSPISAAVAPSQLASAIFRLDASDGGSVELASDGNLASWASIAGDRRVATAWGAYPTQIMTPYGRPAFDFGYTGWNRDMVYTRFTNVRTIFWVMKVDRSGNAFFLGDRFEGSNYHFHRGDNGEYGHVYNSLFSSVWNGTTPVNWASDIPPDNDYMVYSATMSQDCTSNSLTSDRDISQRNGGRQLSEVIFFDSVLADEDRAAIAQYLDQKWKTGELRAPGTLRIDVPEGETVVDSTLRIGGNVKVVKDGAGTFTPARGNCYFGGTEVAAGTLKPGLAGTQFPLGILGTALKIDAGATYDVNGQTDYAVYNVEFAGGTVVNTGASLDGAGPFGTVAITADSYMNLSRSAGFLGVDVNLGGHTLDVTLPQAGQYLCFTAGDDRSFKNGTLKVQGDGMLKIWSPMPNSTDVDMDLSCALWMCWETTVHNLTFRYPGDSYFIDLGRGGFRVGGTFKPMTRTFVRTTMLTGSTLDLTDELGAWDTLSRATSGCGEVHPDHRLMYEAGATITIDLHGRDLAKGERIMKWSEIPADVTFQWDAETAALDANIPPTLKADGLYYGSMENDPSIVTVAHWTGGGNDGDISNSANWACTNYVGGEVVGGVPGAVAEVYVAGDVAFDAASRFRCARFVVGDATLTGDCDWRGIPTPIEFNGLLDLHGHTLRTAVCPEGVGEITSSAEVGVATVPDFVPTDACLWLDASDASTLTIEADGTVSAWNSKGNREVTAQASDSRPVWNPHDWGLPCVDFGGTGSGRDMRYPRFYTLRTVFWVIKIERNGNAFLLGDVDGGWYNFHRNDNGAYGNSQYARYGSVWNGLDPIPDWSGTPIPDTDFQVISAVMVDNCASDSLTNDRNIGGRNGGRQLQEIICFERVLSDAERTQVTQYLQQKWRNPSTPVGKFKLDVPAGQRYENHTLKLSGNLTFVKEGEGTFVAARRGQIYIGGNEVLGGTATTVFSGEHNGDWSFFNSFAYGSPHVGQFRVGSGATFESLGNYDGNILHFVLDGGTLGNRGCPMRLDWGGFGPLEVTADSTFAIDYRTSFNTGGTVYVNDLHGHTLTVAMNGQDFYPYTAAFTNGAMRLEGNGQLVLTSACDWRTVDLYSDGALNLGVPLDVHDYTSAATMRSHSGSAALNVWGVFTPVTDNFYGCTLQNGATLNLSGRTGAFSTVAAFSPSRPTVTIADEASITVDIHGRTLALGDKLVEWTTIPYNATFQWDAESAETAIAQPLVKADGLYYGGEADMTVTDAVWTGAGADGDITNPLNWTCRNASGDVVPEGLPTAVTRVHVTGDVAIDFPAGCACTYGDYDFRDIRLTADCDWRGLDAPSWGRIDLNGHKLYVSTLPASGTIDCLYDPSAAVAPNFIAYDACLWLDAADASTISKDADNKVSQWRSKAGVSIAATQDNVAIQPTYNELDWGRPTLDFGGIGSYIDMNFQRFTNLRTIFWVIKIPQSQEAFLLGDTWAYHFHRGPSGEYCNGGLSQFTSVWNGTTPVENYPNAFIPDYDFQVISATMAEGTCADRLTSDRNIYPRTGGRQLSELICFESVLSDEDRIAVTQYLQQKWFGAAHRGELVVDVPVGRTVSNNGVLIKNHVRVVKTGTGTYVGNLAGQTYAGGTDVQTGTIRPAQAGTQYVFGMRGSEIVLHEGAVFEQNGFDQYTMSKFVLDGGTIRNTGADLAANTALGTIALTADSTIDPRSSLSVWWDGYCVDLGGHTLTVTLADAKYFSIGANSTYIKNGTLDITSGGWFRVWHGALDASTVSLRTACAIDIADDAGPLTVKDYEARYAKDYNNGNNIIKVLGTFKPAAGQYFRGCELQDGAALDLTAQTGIFGLQSAFTSGANMLTFAEDAMLINVVLGSRELSVGRKIVDWTGCAPANRANITFKLDPVSRQMGRRLMVKSDGLYIESGMVMFVR